MRQYLQWISIPSMLYSHFMHKILGIGSRSTVTLTVSTYCRQMNKKRGIYVQICIYSTKNPFTVNEFIKIALLFYLCIQKHYLYEKIILYFGGKTVSKSVFRT